MKKYILFIVLIISNSTFGQRCVSGNCKNGNGTWEFDTNNGSAIKYIGSFKNNTIEGYGTMYFKGGVSITGSFIRNEANGQVQILWPDGEKYVGNMTNFKQMGQGTLYLANGDVWTGIWNNKDFVSGTKNSIAYSNPNYRNRVNSTESDFLAEMVDDLPKAVVAGALVYGAYKSLTNDSNREPTKLEKLMSQCFNKEFIYEFDKQILLKVYSVKCRYNEPQKAIISKIIKINKDGNSNIINPKTNEIFDETDAIEYLAKKMCNCETN